MTFGGASTPKFLIPHTLLLTWIRIIDFKLAQDKRDATQLTNLHAVQ